MCGYGGYGGGCKKVSVFIDSNVVRVQPEAPPTLCMLAHGGGGGIRGGGGGAVVVSSPPRELTLFVTVYPVSGTIIGCADLFRPARHVSPIRGL